MHDSYLFVICLLFSEFSACSRHFFHFPIARRAPTQRWGVGETCTFQSWFHFFRTGIAVTSWRHLQCESLRNLAHRTWRREFKKGHNSIVINSSFASSFQWFYEDIVTNRWRFRSTLSRFAEWCVAHGRKGGKQMGGSHIIRLRHFFTAAHLFSLLTHTMVRTIPPRT